MERGEGIKLDRFLMIATIDQIEAIANALIAASPFFFKHKERIVASARKPAGGFIHQPAMRKADLLPVILVGPGAIKRDEGIVPVREHELKAHRPGKGQRQIIIILD